MQRITPNTIAPNHDIFVFARWENNLDPRYHWRQAGQWMFWRNNTVPLRAYEIDPSLAAYWRPAMDAGVVNWNVSDAPVNFTRNQSTNNRVRAGTFGISLPGYLVYYRVPGLLERFTLSLEAPLIYFFADLRDVDDDLYIESVMAHELGHAVGLEDCRRDPFGGMPNGSIMNASRCRETVRGPTGFDVDLVRMIYD